MCDFDFTRLVHLFEFHLDVLGQDVSNHAESFQFPVVLINVVLLIFFYDCRTFPGVVEKYLLLHLDYCEAKNILG